MPSLTKAYTLTLTVEQFLEACSLTELQEVDLLLNKYIDKKRYTSNSEDSEEFREIPNDQIDLSDDNFDSYQKPVRKTFAQRLEEEMNKKTNP
jgi:hypothetical protein